MKTWSEALTCILWARIRKKAQKWYPAL